MEMRVTVVVDLDTTNIDIEDMRDEILTKAVKVIIQNAYDIQIDLVDPNESVVDYKSLLVESYKETDYLITNLIDSDQAGPNTESDENEMYIRDEDMYWYADVHSVRLELRKIKALNVIPE